jgi:hypothetical protein
VPAPVEPNRESYTPHLTFPGRLIPSIREREKSEAEGQFKAAYDEWEKSRTDWERKKSDWLDKQERVEPNRQHGLGVFPVSEK